MNEETIIQSRPKAQSQQAEEKKQGVAWKQVTLGGVSGILMGAGLLYAGQASSKALESAEAPEETQDVQAPEPGETSHTLENGLQVAAVSDDLSFGEAFAAARAEVGPGGVFHWHGGIYNTYTADEWNAMTVEQKHDFAQQVKPEIRPDEIPTPTDAHPDVAVHHATEATPEPQPAADSDVQVASEQTVETADSDADVHIVGYGEVQGHVAVGLDTDGDGQADVAIIDVDDSGNLSDADVIVDNEGHVATYGEINNAPDPNQMASMENPDVAPDMPDYMNDANVDDMNVLT